MRYAHHDLTAIIVFLLQTVFVTGNWEYGDMTKLKKAQKVISKELFHSRVQSSDQPWRLILENHRGERCMHDSSAVSLTVN